MRLINIIVTKQSQQPNISYFLKSYMYTLLIYVPLGGAAAGDKPHIGSLLNNAFASYEYKQNDDDIYSTGLVCVDRCVCAVC